ncbi:MAG: alpha/beta fold hydrolase [Cocleimonas sp.]
MLLKYKTFGSESNITKIPLFILHGLLGSMDNWRTQAKRLSENRQVYTLDLRNHGSSPHLKGMSYREMYEDVIEVIRHENLEEVHLLGHSMGGKVAMQLALAQASFIKSLIVVDIAPKPYPLWHQKTLHAVINAPVTTMNSRQDVDNYLKPSIEDATERSFMIKNLKRNKDADGFSWRCNLQEISRGYLKIAGFSTALEQFPDSTLFIRGEDSNYINESDQPLIQNLFPKAEIFSINRSGHLPHIQQADHFFEMVNTFLITKE